MAIRNLFDQFLKCSVILRVVWKEMYNDSAEDSKIFHFKRSHFVLSFGISQPKQKHYVFRFNMNFNFLC